MTVEGASVLPWLLACPGTMTMLGAEPSCGTTLFGRLGWLAGLPGLQMMI